MFVSDLASTPLVESFLDGGRELGYEINDVNAGGSQMGYSMLRNVTCEYVYIRVSMCIYVCMNVFVCMGHACVYGACMCVWSMHV